MVTVTVAGGPVGDEVFPLERGQVERSWTLTVVNREACLAGRLPERREEAGWVDA